MTRFIRPARALMAGGALLLSGGASAGEFSRDPCEVPVILAPAPGPLQATFTRLKAKAAELDDTSRAFNTDCDQQKVVGSPGEVACARRETVIGDALDAHGRTIDAYHRDITGLFQGRIAALDSQMAETRGQLQRVSRNTQAWQKEIEDWTELGEEARNEARLKAVSTVAEMVMEDEQEGLKEDIALDQDAIGKLKSLYAADRSAIPAEFGARLEQELMTLRTKRDVLMLFQQLHLTAERAYSTAQPLTKAKAAEGLGQFTVGVLKESLLFMQASPEAKMTVAAFDMGQDALYGWWVRIVAERRINQFNGLQEQQLHAVDALSRIYISQVDRRKALKTALAALQAAPCYKAS